MRPLLPSREMFSIVSISKYKALVTLLLHAVEQPGLQCIDTVNESLRLNEQIALIQRDMSFREGVLA